MNVGLKTGLFLAIALTAPQTRAATLLSDNFNGENGGVGTLNYTGFANFNVTSGSVDLIGNGFFDFLPGNGLFVDLDGSTGAAGTLTTKQSFAPGNYTLSFNLAGTQRGIDGVVTVSFGTFSQTIDLISNTGFTLETFDVAVTSQTSMTLSFASQVPGNLGALLDNVVVTSASGGGGTSTPEPASAALLAGGLLALGAIRRARG